MNAIEAAQACIQAQSADEFYEWLNTAGPSELSTDIYTEHTDDPRSELVNAVAQSFQSGTDVACEAVETGAQAVAAFQRGQMLYLFNFSAESVDLGPVELGPWGYAWLPADEV